MNEPTYPKRKRNAIWLCLSFFLLVFFDDELSKFFSWLPLSSLGKIVLGGTQMLTLLILFIALVINFAKEVQCLYYGYKERSTMILFPFAIYLITFALVFQPIHLRSEIFRSKALYVATYQSTAAGSVYTFRRNQRFEEGIYSFGSSEYLYGTWKKDADTIYLTYNGVKDKNGSFDTLIKAGNFLVPPHELSMPKEKRWRGFKLLVQPD